MSFRPFQPRAVRGAIEPARLIALVGVVLIAAGAAWWFFGRTPGSSVAPAPGATTTTPAATTDSATAPVAVVSDELTTDQLYKEARKAMGENRMAAPAGNNALEFYLKIVAKQPDDSGAKDALRELFPFATGAAEDQINQGAFDEANRIIALLAQADPSNYSLTILRSKLDAKRKQADRDQQQAALAAAAAARTPAGTATTPAPGATTATTSPADSAAAMTPAAAPAATPPVETATAAVTPPPTPAAAPPPAAATPPPAATGATRDATVTTPPVPDYPLAAARNRQEGWVEVEFTVAPDGSVQNARVIGSNPARIFDREAINAVQRAKFEPRLQNGEAVASTLRRRIEFKLGR